MRTHTYHAAAMPDHLYNSIVSYMQKLEDVFKRFAPPKIVRQIQAALKLLEYPTMQTKDESIKLDIFSGIAIGQNVFLQSHTDQDFALSVVSLHVKGHQYKINGDDVMAYFCFPRLGIAVALRPGDVLIFNPLEPHAISSTCSDRKDVFCVSYYLKTAVVGLNDNGMELEPHEEKLAALYKESK